MNNDYQFTNLDLQAELLGDISALEQKIEQTIGKKVNLIAYSPTNQEETHSSSSNNNQYDI